MRHYQLKNLNEKLFDQLDRLIEAKNDEELEIESNRAKSITSVTREIIQIARISLDAEIALNEGQVQRLPRLIDDSNVRS